MGFVSVNPPPPTTFLLKHRGMHLGNRTEGNLQPQKVRAGLGEQCRGCPDIRDRERKECRRKDMIR